MSHLPPFKPVPWTLALTEFSGYRLDPIELPYEGWTDQSSSHDDAPRLELPLDNGMKIVLWHDPDYDDEIGAPFEIGLVDDEENMEIKTISREHTAYEAALIVVQLWEDAQTLTSLNLWGSEFKYENTGGGCLALVCYGTDGSAVMISAYGKDGEGLGHLPTRKDWCIGCYDAEQTNVRAYLINGRNSFPVKVCHSATIPGQPPVVLEQRADGAFRVSHGDTARDRLTYKEAAFEFGSFVMQALARTGALKPVGMD